jgi:hypothetical protein
MYLLDTGELTGTLDDFAGWCRTDRDNAGTALRDIGERGVAKVTWSDDRKSVSILSRRIDRDCKRREYERLRKAGQREKKRVPQMSPPVVPVLVPSTPDSRCQMPDKEPLYAPPGAGAVAPVQPKSKHQRKIDEHDAAVKALVEPLTEPWKAKLLEHCDERKKAKHPHTERSLRTFIADLLTWPPGLAATGLDMAIKRQWRIAERAWVEKELGATSATASPPRPRGWTPSEADIAATVAEMKAKQDADRAKLLKTVGELPL